MFLFLRERQLLHSHLNSRTRSVNSKMTTLKVWPVGKGQGTRMGYRDVNRTVGAGREEVPLELRDGGGKQWTMETGGKRSTQICLDFLLLALLLTPTHCPPDLLLGRYYSDCSFMQQALLKYIIRVERTIFKGIKLACQHITVKYSVLLYLFVAIGN